MDPKTLQQRFASVLDEHAALAEASAHDWKVCVRAVAAARARVMAVPTDARRYADRVLLAVEELMESYRDPNGVDTNGVGVIGSVLSDLRHVAG